MRLGNSGLGVIAVVSLLVTAAPGRNDGIGNDRDGRIDHLPDTIVTVRLSSAHYSWSNRVSSLATGTVQPKTSNPQSSTSTRLVSVRHNDRNTETPTSFTRRFNDLFVPIVDTRPSKNSESSSNSPNDRYIHDTSGSLSRAIDTLDSSVRIVSPSRNFEEKFVVTDRPPIFNSITDPTMSSSHGPRVPRSRWRRRRDERETISRDGTTRFQKEYDEGRSMWNDRVTTTTNKRTVREAESAITMSHPLTTMTSTMNRTVTSEVSHVDVNYRKPTGNNDTPITFKSRKSSDKETLEKANSDNGPEPRIEPISRTMSLEDSDVLHSNNSYPTNYSIGQVADVHSSNPIQVSSDEPSKDLENPETGPSLGLTLRLSSTNHSVQEYPSKDPESSASKTKSLVGDPVIMEDKGSTTGSQLKTGKQESFGDKGVNEVISGRRQITRETLNVSPLVTAVPRLSDNQDNTSDADSSFASLDNHKDPPRVRSFKTSSAELQRLETIVPGSSSLPARLLDSKIVKDLLHKDTNVSSARTERPASTLNQVTFPKSIPSFDKNSTKPSLNHSDGKSNKIFYEIKPSLITDMDRDDDIDVTTTTRRSFEKFLLPSVPSAFGKFGPYFLDEEDRRNVTERIGNTVQLNCRIGLLGHRKVTWLQHYKDSFRLLTVERESYSVDRRISLNFQYPDNWRLQIAYATMRDSGLYKCQVEIDQDRSLVKRYNVIITAPILTITDDSGRPVSGERHLKAGSALKLRCEARDVLQRLNESVLWMRGDETLTNDVSENRTTEMANENEIMVVISTLLVERASPRHAGNYSCIVADKAKTTIAVHVLNGELPAAVQHGSGVSTAVLNIWLVHLTASYGFFR